MSRRRPLKDTNKIMLGPSGEEACSSKKKSKSKKQVNKTAKVGNEEFRYTLEFETEDVPEQGSDAMFDAIFKAAKTFRPLKPTSSTPTKSSSSAASNSRPLRSKSKNVSSSVRNLREWEKRAKAEGPEEKLSDFDQETADLLRETEELLKTPEKPTGNQYTAAENSYSDTIFDVSKNNDSFETSMSTSFSSTNPTNKGKLILITVTYKEQRLCLMVYSKQQVYELRKEVGEKTKVSPDLLEIYFGDSEKIEDGRSLESYNIENGAELDAYYRNITDKDLFSARNADSLRFKLQTSDRRGRQNALIYVPRSMPMRAVRDQYAKEMGMDPATISLSFDGDKIDLDSLPQDCDLEGDECIDVMIG